MTAPAPYIGALDIEWTARAESHEVLRRLGSGPGGLSQEEAARRLAAFGPNVLHEHHVTAIGVLLRQLRNPLLILLTAAATVSAGTGEPTDAAIIGVIIGLSIGLGFFNEYRAERAVAELHSRIKHEAVVIREGRPQSVDVTRLVPGDVVQLQVGDIVPADLRLLDTNGLECDESILTGESLPAEKTGEAIQHLTSGLDLPSCAFMGTVVHAGSARAVVVRSAGSTALGAIARGLGTGQTYTRFQAGLTSFSKLLVGIAAVLTTAIFVINVIYARPIIDALLFSLAIAIGITPQLLPAIVSVSLAAGSSNLARKRVLVKRLVSIEDLGNIRTLFTDKTGTLTEGAIAFDRSLGPDGRPAPRALLLGLVCNDAAVTEGEVVGGNALDQALWRAPEAHALAAQSDGPGTYRRLSGRPFDPRRQLASVLVELPDGARLLIVKGAPEAVMARCPAGSEEPTTVVERLFAEGARVVAVASRPLGEGRELKPEDETALRLEGFLTFRDPIKADASDSIARLLGLGIDIKIITGDNGLVAQKVCADLGLPVAAVVTGDDLSALNDDELSRAIPQTTIFSRIGPNQKGRIITVARRGGDDVAFMGDGVNDAVALHGADVGISVDSATDVAKDAADIVLLDKDLGVLAGGVMEGRRIFANTLKYVLMATSSNFGNMFSAAGASLFLSFLPMLPSQVLLNNLLYDAGQLAIPTDGVDEEVLARPADWDIGFIRRFMATFGPVSSVFDFLTFFVMLSILGAGPAEFRTGWFVESLATQTLVIFVIRTRRVPFFRSRPSRWMAVVPVAMASIGAALPLTPVAGLLGFRQLPPLFFAILLAMILAYLTLAELTKFLFYRAQRLRIEPPTQARVDTQEPRRVRQIRRRARRFALHVRPSLHVRGP